MIRFTTLLVAASVALVAHAAPSLAQSSSQIEDALKPKVDPNKPVTRSLTRSIGAADPKTAAEKQVLDRARTRAISIEAVQPAAKEEREQIAEIVKDKPKIDLEITFDYNSWAISPRAVPVLVNLGRALSDPDLKGTVFLVGGHTDAAGSPEYNLDLSQKRAHAVREYLSRNFGIPVDALVAIGFGKEQIKLPHDPLAEANRRVQVVNIAK